MLPRRRQQLFVSCAFNFDIYAHDCGLNPTQQDLKMNAEDRAKGGRAARSPPLAPSSPDKGAARDRDGHSQVTADGRPREFGKQPKKSKPQQAARAQDEGVGGTAFPALATPGAKERPAGSPTGGGSKDRGKDTLPQMATATPTKPNSGQRSSRSRRSSSFVSINASEAPTSRTGRARFGNSCRGKSRATSACVLRGHVHGCGD